MGHNNQLAAIRRFVLAVNSVSLSALRTQGVVATVHTNHDDIPPLMSFRHAYLELVSGGVCCTSAMVKTSVDSHTTN